MAYTRVFQVYVVVVFFKLLVNGSPSYFLRNFYARADWGATPALYRKPLKLPVPYVVIHHTYLPAACYTFEQCSSDMRSMQNYHNSLDWGDIGYNFCVGSDGGAYEGRGWDNLGIHAGPANNYSIGICVIGDWTVDRPNLQELTTTKALIATGVLLGKISPNYKLIGHNQTMSTECPGNGLLAEIASWEHYYPGMIDFKALKALNTSVPIDIED